MKTKNKYNVLCMLFYSFFFLFLFLFFSRFLQVSQPQALLFSFFLSFFLQLRYRKVDIPVQKTTHQDLSKRMGRCQNASLDLIL